MSEVLSSLCVSIVSARVVRTFSGKGGWGNPNLFLPQKKSSLRDPSWYQIWLMDILVVVVAL
jgi:hypothetical protein